MTMTAEFVRLRRNAIFRAYQSAGLVACQLCHRPATDWHHILGRGLTHPNTFERFVLDNAALGIPLCRTCNVELADTKTARMKLVQIAAEKYGFTFFRTLLVYVQGVTNIDLSIELEAIHEPN